MRRADRIILALLFLLLNATAAPAQTDILPGETVTGSVTTGASQSWNFRAGEGAVMSFLATATSGDLDPVLTLSNRAGEELLSSDDYAYPDTTDALLEAISLPATDTYTVTVSGFGATAGDFLLTLLPGFAEQYLLDSFDTENWTSASAALTVTSGEGQIALDITEPGERGLATGPDTALADFYAEISVVEINSRNGWTVGLTARHQDSRNYYLFVINQRGEWRFAARTLSGDQDIRGWVTHPAIVPGTTTFTLGLLANGSRFEFFYDGQLIGRVTDNTISEPGMIGLLAETPSTLNSELTVQFDNLLVTTPLMLDGNRPLPQQVITGPSTVMVPNLERRGLIPTNGETAVIVPESFVTFNRPGVNRFMLGGGQSLGTFAIGTTVSWEAASEGVVGCGLVLHATDDTNYTLAYIDQNGGFGLSRRTGDNFAPGIFGEDPAIVGRDRHHLLVIATADALHLYVDGRYGGTLDDAGRTGEFGTAVVNFDPIATSCQFEDTWVWRW